MELYWLGMSAGAHVEVCGQKVHHVLSKAGAQPQVSPTQSWHFWHFTVDITVEITVKSWHTREAVCVSLYGSRGLHDSEVDVE